MDKNADPFDSFLDGLNYTDAELESFFSGLNSNPEITEEISSMEFISEAIDFDTEAQTPPSQAKEEIFKNLGLSIPKNTLVKPIPAPFFQRFIRKALIPAAAVIGILFVAYYAGKDDSNLIENKNTRQEIAKVKFETQPSNSNAVVSQSSVNKSHSKFPLSSSTAVNSDKKSNSVTSNSNSSRNNFADNNIQSDNKISEVQSISETKYSEAETPNTNDITQLSQDNSINLLRSTRHENVYVSYQSNFSTYQFGTYSPSNFTLYFRSLSGTTFSKQAFSSLPNNSYSLGFYTPLFSSDDLNLCVEFGAEPFEKKYFDKNSEQLVSTENPQLFWGAVGVRYNQSNYIIPELNASLFASALIGAGELGPLTKASIGFDYKISNSFSAFTAIEGALVMYNNKTQWLSSKKLGLSFGIAYNF